MRFELTSVDRVFSRLKGTMPLDQENDIIEWIGDALQQIGAITQFKETVCFAEVRNYRVAKPKFCHAIIQLARNRRADFVDKSTLATPSFITNNYIQVGPSDDNITPDIPVAVDQYGEPVNAYELAYYRPFFELQYGYYNWISSNVYKSAFSPIRLATNTMFMTEVCQEQDYDAIYSGCEDEYKLDDGMLKFSFKEGQVAIAYARQQVDEEGRPMIPDEISYITAAADYCRWQYYSREFYTGTEGAEKKMLTAEGNWVWYCGQASSKALMVSGVDEHENLLKQRSYILPRKARYFNFFKNLNKGENRAYNNPGRR